MPKKIPTSYTVEMRIRFNKALETFKHFTSKWNDQAKQYDKDVKEALNEA